MTASSWRAAGAAWLASRAWAALAAVVAGAVARDRAPGVPAGAPDVLAPLALRWDALHFADLARHGYPRVPSGDWAFFPGFPALARLLGGSGTGLWWAGTLLAVLGGALALVLLHRLALVEGLDAAAARRAVWLLALFPGAFALGASYSEGPFLLATVGAVLAARTGRWAGAGALGAAATLLRPTGIVVLVPLALLARRERLPARRAAWLALGPLALGGWLAYAGARAGDVLAPLHAQAVWGRGFHGPLAAIPLGVADAATAVPHLLSAGAAGDFEPPWMKLVLLAVLALGVAGTIGAWRAFGAPLGLLCALGLALPLSSPWPEHPLMSLPRFLVVLFPIFLWLATKPRAARLAGVLFAAGLAVFAGRFAVWAWAA